MAESVCLDAPGILPMAFYISLGLLVPELGMAFYAMAKALSNSERSNTLMRRRRGPFSVETSVM